MNNDVGRSIGSGILL